MRSWFVCAVIVIGCGKRAGDPATRSTPGSGGSAAGSATHVADRTAALDRLTTGLGATRSGQPWADAFERLRGALGAPTLVEGSRYVWAVAGTGWCARTWIKRDVWRDSGEVVGYVGEPLAVDTDRSLDWFRCMAGTGAKPDTYEDANVPSPPTRGETTLAQFVEGMTAARSRWHGRELTFEGIVTSFSRVAGHGASTIELRPLPDSPLVARCHFQSSLDEMNYTIGERLRIRGRASDRDLFGDPGLADCTREKLD